MHIENDALLVLTKNMKYLDPTSISAIDYVTNTFTLVELFKSLWSLFYILGHFILMLIDFSVVLQCIFLM